MRAVPLTIPIFALAAALLTASVASAQEGEASAGGEDEVQSLDHLEQEGIDPTRLDVERLPPEAIEITREMYSHGFFIEAMLGGRGFVGGVGRYSDPGLYARVAFGYEVAEFFYISALAEGSIHQTNAPAPPARAVFELVGGLIDLRFQVNPTAQFAMWLSIQGGVLISTTDVLGVYGFQNTTDVSPTYGGELGFDGHFKNRHASIGLSVGARHYPSLEGVDGSPAVGLHGAAYLRYVF